MYSGIVEQAIKKLILSVDWVMRTPLKSFADPPLAHAAIPVLFKVMISPPTESFSPQLRCLHI